MIRNHITKHQFQITIIQLTTVPISESQKIVKAIKKCDKNADVTFTTIPGGTHGSVESLFHTDALYNWLFEHVKN